MPLSDPTAPVQPSTPTPTPTPTPTKDQVITPSRKVLILLGLLELIFPSLALYMAFPLLRLFSSLQASNAAPYVGLVFFSIAWLTAFAQLVVGLLNVEVKLGDKATKALIILGIICSVLIIPAMIVLLINPIYTLVGSS